MNISPFLPGLSIATLLLLAASSLPAQTPAGSPQHTFYQGEIPVPYAPASVPEIKAVLNRVLGYLEAQTPVRLLDLDSGRTVTSPETLPANPGLAPTEYPLTGYEWGVTYSGMLLAGRTLKDARFTDYAGNRLGAIAAVAAGQRERLAASGGRLNRSSLRSVLQPRSLDDSGSISAAMIKATRDGIHVDDLRPCIDGLLHWISDGQERLADGTLCRNRPMPHMLWLDDLYMSVPALAQMGALTGERRYFDDAVQQVTQFADRMFVPEKGIFRHGWAEAMDPHPTFAWARANGWAIMAMAELLSVLPEDHPGRDAVLRLYRAHAQGLAGFQGATGLWHQVLDRADSYPETSASAMFVYALARGVNRGWLDALAYGPMISLGWNAVAQRVNAQGQIEDVCVGTGMGWDPAFYYFRPTSVWAAHGFGPVLLAGAEMVTLREGKGAGAYDGSARVDGVQFYAP